MYRYIDIYIELVFDIHILYFDIIISKFMFISLLLTSHILYQ